MLTRGSDLESCKQVPLTMYSLADDACWFYKVCEFFHLPLGDFEAYEHKTAMSQIRKWGFCKKLRPIFFNMIKSECITPFEVEDGTCLVKYGLRMGMTDPLTG